MKQSLVTPCLLVEGSYSDVGVWLVCRCLWMGEETGGLIQYYNIYVQKICNSAHGVNIGELYNRFDVGTFEGHTT